MRLLVSTHHELLEVSEDYFKQTTTRCADGQGPCYIASTGARCVIGNVIFCEDDYERFWLRSYRGNAQGLFYGLGIHPITRLANVALELQIIHDAPNNWLPTGFANWDEFFRIQEEYR